MKAREAAVLILNSIERDKSYAALKMKTELSRLLSDSREKAFATELIYGAIRYKMHLDFVRDTFSAIRVAKLSTVTIEILRISIYQLLYLEKIPPSAVCNEAVSIAKKHVNGGAAKYVNGLLRAFLRNKDRLPYPADEMEKFRLVQSYPKWLMELWINDYGIEKAKEMALHSNSPKGVRYRINRLKAPSDFVLSEELSAPDQEKAFAMGYITVQDAGSMRAVEVLNPNPNARVLDLCAAPGGKTCYMSELMDNTGQITACDIHPHRIELICQTAERLGAKNIACIQNDSTLQRSEWKNAFDFVLADVPCSGLGVISGKPDIKWRKQSFDKLTEIQYNILNNAMQYVKNGGALVYSTCTVHKAENEEVVARALRENKEFSIEGEMLQLFPTFENDGFFICKLKRCD